MSNPAVGQAVWEEIERVLGRQPSARPAVLDLHLQDDLGLDSVMVIELKCRLELRYPALRDLPLSDVLSGAATVVQLAGRVERLVGLAVT
ncbi:phosphopantetheine-binding protein [Streptomyces sp. NPDC006544]|uniref:acyl carrier protein n=1 Tax=Streptomyces sp. NPDC006544 TaxID=3154583 RepID=UPI0033AF8864